MECDRNRERILLLLYGEIDPAAHSELQQHIEGCSACRVALAEEHRLLAVLAERPPAEPSPALLARCRTDLELALREKAAPRLARPAWWAGLQPTPIYALLFLTIGFLAGWIAPGRGFSSVPGSAVVPAGQGEAPEIEAVVAGLKSLQADAGTGQISLSYDLRRSTSLVGHVTDPRIRDLLVETVRRSPNAGLRLDAVDALRRHVDDEGVRSALLRAIQQDRNAGVRLKALGAFDSRTIADPAVRGAFMDAMLRDENPGVRVWAIDALARARIPELLPVMERLARQDRDAYVRLRSNAFVDEMSAREMQ